ncbi:MAG: phosphoribosylamine--glycine ligase [Deltaproteobacteria bacterium]|nr:phosphoribosylamine--glycine ligase [Nannocystaceae bacterium]
MLIIGGGGREHALAWKLARDGAEVVVAPGNDGIAEHAECVAIEASDVAGLIELARARRIELAVVGPEQPLVDGLADALRDAGVPTFGPSQAAARLEGSKVDAKRFMVEHGIPTARSVVVHELGELAGALARFSEPPVVKADGLAAGKGVTVAESFAEAEHAVRQCLERRAFGSAGAKVVLEQRLRGQEVSFFVLTDGSHAVTLAPAQDHKRIGEGDTGPNTGGMGVYAPAPIFDARARARTMQRVVEPTLAGLRAAGRPFVGVLFVGLMIDEHADPWVIEYNGLDDPELIRALYAASRAGVEVRLVVRGLCTLKPGVDGMSDRIRVRGVIGRFLEHARIYHFADGGTDEYLIGSADWRSRNLRRRVEVVAPVLDPACRERLDRILTREFDDRSAWELAADGSYRQLASLAVGDPSTSQAQAISELQQPQEVVWTA